MNNNFDESDGKGRKICSVFPSCKRSVTVMPSNVDEPDDKGRKMCSCFPLL